LAALRFSTPKLYRDSISPTMCGIFFSLSRDGYIAANTNTKQLLQNRGPDSTGQLQTVIEAHSADAEQTSTKVFATFLSTVLALRGNDVIEQPLRDDATGSVLCWNGEAWSIAGDVVNGNDSQLVFAKLLEACVDEASTRNVIDLLSCIRGPYALVFYDARNERIYYGRDCLGRRSLLRKSTSDSTLVLSSVCDNASGEAWSEVEADGIYLVDLRLLQTTSISGFTQHIAHRRAGDGKASELSFVGKSSGMRVLLTQTGLTLSSLKPQCLHPRLSSTF
jgi:glutamine phosphoribosylpyrophosphate amidotransferase